MEVCRFLKCIMVVSQNVFKINTFSSHFYGTMKMFRRSFLELHSQTFLLLLNTHTFGENLSCERFLFYSSLCIFFFTSLKERLFFRAISRISSNSNFSVFASKPSEIFILTPPNSVGSISVFLLSNTRLYF